MRRLSAVFCLMLPVLGHAAEPAWWRYAHPNAQALIGVQCKQAAQAPLWKMIQDQFAGRIKSETGGLDFVEELDRILVSSPARPGSGLKGEPPFLVVMTGRFKLPELKKAAARQGAVTRRYKSTELLLAPRSAGENVHVAIVDERTILAGDEASVKAALDRGQAGSSARGDGGLFARASALADTHEVWAVIRDLQGLSGSKLQGAAWLQDVKSLELGLNLKSGIGLLLQMQAADELKARSLASGLATMAAMAAYQQQKDQPQLAEVLKRASVTTAGTTVSIALNIEQERIAEGIAQLKSSFPMIQGVARGTPGTELAATRASRAQEPTRKTIRIEGLDEGPREIPYQPQ